MPFFVDVPNVPGIPQVSFAANAGVLGAVSSLLTGDLIPDIFFAEQQWGIYQNGSPVVIADSVVAVEHKREWSLSDYPIEQGGFETYDKVSLPHETRLRFSAGGSIANRQALLSSIIAIADTTDLFDIVTPEVIYSNVSIVHHDYRRTPINGLGLMQIDIWCMEVRVNSNPDFTSSSSTGSNNSTASSAVPSSSSDAAQTNGGAVQAAPTSSAQSNGITTGFANPSQRS